MQSHDLRFVSRVASNSLIGIFLYRNFSVAARCQTVSGYPRASESKLRRRSWAWYHSGREQRVFQCCRRWPCYVLFLLLVVLLILIVTCLAFWNSRSSLVTELISRIHWESSSLPQSISFRCQKINLNKYRILAYRQLSKTHIGINNIFQTYLHSPVSYRAAAPNHSVQHFIRIPTHSCVGIPTICRISVANWEVRVRNLQQIAKLIC